jgi:hypothetical protein
MSYVVEVGVLRADAGALKAGSRRRASVGHGACFTRVFWCSPVQLVSSMVLMNASVSLSGAAAGSQPAAEHVGSAQALLAGEQEVVHPYLRWGLEPELADAAIAVSEAEADFIMADVAAAEELAARLRDGATVEALVEERGVDEESLLSLLKLLPQFDFDQASHATVDWSSGLADDREALVNRGWGEVVRREQQVFGCARRQTVRHWLRRLLPAIAVPAPRWSTASASARRCGRSRRTNRRRGPPRESGRLENGGAGLGVRPARLLDRVAPLVELLEVSGATVPCGGRLA